MLRDKNNDKLSLDKLGSMVLIAIEETGSGDRGTFLSAVPTRDNCNLSEKRHSRRLLGLVPVSLSNTTSFRGFLIYRFVFWSRFVSYAFFEAGAPTIFVAVVSGYLSFSRYLRLREQMLFFSKHTQIPNVYNKQLKCFKFSSHYLLINEIVCFKEVSSRRYCPCPLVPGLLVILM